MSITRALRVFALLLASAWLGCASPPFGHLALPDLTADTPTVELGDRAVVQPSGPGTVFASPQDAAFDALAYCYLEARQVVPTERLARGGAIRAIPGGFTYDEPTLERGGVLGQLRYALGRGDVAHFQFYPRISTAAFGRASESASARARRFVERRDPIHRPVFYLLPDRYVRVYDASEVGERTLARIAFGTRRGATELAMSPALDALGEAQRVQPLALQPGMGR